MFLALACKNKIKKTSTDFLIENNQSIEIVNYSNTTSCFDIQFNNKPNHIKQLLTDINNLSNKIENEQIELKAWRYVIENVNYAPTNFTSVDLHHPLVLLNSIGYGQCDDLAITLYFIWKELGFQSRVWDLGNHVVPEIYINNKWQMYDPSFQVFYFNRNNEIASVEELLNDSSLILYPIKKLNYAFAENINLNSLDSLRYGLHVASYYKGEPQINEFYTQTFMIDSLRFCIPSNSSLVFPFSKNNLIVEKNWKSEIVGENLFLKLKLSEKSEGKISIPLVYTKHYGEFELINFENKSIDSKSLTDYFINDDFKISNVFNESEILYKLALNTKASNKVKIYNYNLNQVEFIIKN